MSILNGLLPIASFSPAGCSIRTHTETLPEFSSTSKFVSSRPMISPISAINIVIWHYEKISRIYCRSVG